MALIPVENVGETGIVKDINPWQLPPNVWSDGNNVEFDNSHDEVQLKNMIEIQNIKSYENYVNCSLKSSDNDKESGAEQITNDIKNYYKIH